MTTIECTVMTDGEGCLDPVTLTLPTPLCDVHKIQIVMSVLPDLLTTAFREATLASGRQLTADVVHMIRSSQAASMPKAEPHPALVYFMANGGRVKIGYTKSLFSRISGLSLRTNAVLLLLHGGIDLERALHSKFDMHRVGDSEWFELAPEIVNFISSKGPKHRVGSGKRPARRRTTRQLAVRPQKEQRALAKETITALFADLQRRPRESEMVAALRDRNLSHSRQYANKLRAEIESEEPHLVGLGSDVVRPLTG